MSEITLDSCGSRLVGIDFESPDRILAGREPWRDGDEDTDADFAPDDNGETIDAAGMRDIPRDALRTLLRFIIPASNSSGRRWRVAQLRLVSLARMIDVDDLAAVSLEELGRELKCTRALLSLYQVRICDSLGQSKASTGKTRLARESYRQAAIRSHRARGHAMTATAAP